MEDRRNIPFNERRYNTTKPTRETAKAKEERLAKQARERYLNTAPKALYQTVTWHYNRIIDDWEIRKVIVPDFFKEGEKVLTLREVHPTLYGLIVGLRELRMKKDTYMLCFHKEKHGYIVERWYKLNGKPKPAY